MHAWRLGLWLAAWTTLAGCGGPPPIIVPPPQPPGEAQQQAQKHFERGREALADHDRRGDWNEARCRETAQRFAAAAEQARHAKRPRAAIAARYNQGLALARCQLRDAEGVFASLLVDAPRFVPARVQHALWVLEREGDHGLDAAIAAVRGAIEDAHFGNADALVHLAILQMRRSAGSADADGRDDHDRAGKNLRRALAIDDTNMAAYNQLALHQLAQAGRGQRGHLVVAHAACTPADSAALELAALICSQAQQKQPKYAPIHNTAGLISAELGDLSQAARAFETARKLDPRLFEAHMNYAAVNLQFRGFVEAQEAYSAALVLSPNDYDARLGLALALRGQAGHASSDALVARSLAELHKAKALDPARPEAYFNEAVLVQEFRARGAGASALNGLRSARGLFEDFVSRAKADATADATMADALVRARSRVDDIDQIIAVLEAP